MAAEMGFQRACVRPVAEGMRSRATAPEASRIDVKLAASMLPLPSAKRHRIELAAKARRASAVRRKVRRA
jgi:hypothetical protein